MENLVTFVKVTESFGRARGAKSEFGRVQGNTKTTWDNYCQLERVSESSGEILRV